MHVRPTGIYTHINCKTIRDSRSPHSDLDARSPHNDLGSFHSQHPIRGLWLGLGLGLGLQGYKVKKSQQVSVLSPTLPGAEGISGWLSPPCLILRDLAGSTCSRARYQQRELLSTWYDLVRYMQAPNRLGNVG